MPKLINTSIDDDDQGSFDLEFFDEERGSGVAPMHETVAKKVAAMSTVMDSADIQAQYENIKHSLTTQGRSDDVDRLLSIAELDMEEDDVQSAEILIRDKSLPHDDKVRGLFEIQDRISARKDVRIEDAFMADNMMSATAYDAQEEKVQQGFFRNEEAISRSNSEIESLIRQKALSFDSSTGAALADFAVTAVVPGFGIKLKQIVDEVSPEDGPALWNLAPGESIAEFKKVFNQSAPEDRVEMAKRVLTAMDETFTSSIHDNDFEKYDFLNTLLGDLNPSDAAIDSDRWINNAFGVLDLIPVLGTAASSLIRIGRRVPKSSPLSHMASSSPREAQEWAMGAIQDDALADAMNTTKADVAGSGVFPKSAAEPREAFPDINKKMEELDVDVKGLDSHGINYTPTEKIAAEERAVKLIDQLNKTEGVHLLNQTEIEHIPGGYRTQFTIGHSDVYGFPNIHSAKDAAEGYLEVQNGARVTYVKKDFETGEYVPAAADDLEEGEFLAQIDVKHIYNPGDTLPGSLDEAFVGVTGPGARFVDKSSVFGQWIVNAGNVAADKSALIRHQLTKKVGPALKLSTKKQGEVFEALSEGDQLKKWFNEAELIEKFNGDRELITAYNGARAHQEAIYELQNSRFRGRADASGLKQLFNPETGYTRMAKPVQLEDIREDTIRLYDPDLERIIDITPNRLDEIYEEGGKVYRLPGDEHLGDEMYDLVLVGRGSKTASTQLPAYVLNKLDGYITRDYDVNYIVKELRSGVHKNGKLVDVAPGTFAGRTLGAGDTLRAVKMASNRSEAERAARQLNATAEGETIFGVVEAKELQDLNYVQQQSYDFFRDHGQLYFSKRGAEIENVTGVRTLSGIGEAMEMARNNVARHIGMDDFIQSMTTRWEKAYGGRFGVGDDKMPMSGKIVHKRAGKEGLSQEDIIDQRKATALRDHISSVAGSDQVWTRQIWNRLVVNIADKVAGVGENRFREAISTYALSKRTKDPISFLKKVAFARFIALNPARQLLLQSQQATVYLGLDHGFKYFASGAGVRDHMGLTLGMIAKDRPEMWRVLAPQIAKGMKMSTKEYRQFIDAFNQTGLAAAIDSHPFANAVALGRQATLADNPLVQGWKNVKETMNTVTRTARMIGFDAGEYNNIAVAWLAVRNKWIKNNPGKSWTDPDVLVELGAEARAVGLNMNSAGALAFQKGTLGLLTQFMSHATKSAQLLIPMRTPVIGKLSNKTFKGRERGRIAIMQLALYGTGGFGLHKAYESMRDSLNVEVPDIANMAIREGITGSILNAAIRAADVDGEESDVQFSPSFGPLSGTPTSTPVMTLAKGMIEGILISPLNSDTWRSLGPGLSLATDMKGLWDISVTMIGADSPDVSTVDKATVFMREMGKFLPGYSNYVRASAAQKMGQMVSGRGNPTVQATTGEAMARMWFGLRSQKEVGIGDLLRELQGFTRSVGEEGLDKELKDVSNTLYKNTMRLARSLDDGDIDAETMLKLSKGERESLKVALGDVQFWRMMSFFQRRVFSDMNVNNEVRLTKVLQSYYSRGALPPKHRAINTVRNLPDFEGKNEILKWIDYTL